jgi:hypothetical protein
VVGASAARAQQEPVVGLDASAFRLAPLGDNDLVQVSGTTVTGHLAPTVGVAFDYGYSQLIVKDCGTATQAALLEHRLSADVVAALSL